MSRRRLLILARAGTLVAGLIAIHALLVLPAWKRAAVEAAREAALATDCQRVQSNWDNLTVSLLRRHPQAAAAAGLADAPAAAGLADAAAARLLALDPVPPAAGLPRLNEAVPRFLGETARLAATYGIAWTAIRASRPEPALVSLPGGGSIPLSSIRVHLSGSGPYASLGRAMQELLGGEAGAVIRDLSIRSGHHGTVAAELELDLYGAP